MVKKTKAASKKKDQQPNAAEEQDRQPGWQPASSRPTKMFSENTGPYDKVEQEAHKAEVAIGKKKIFASSWSQL